jgi:hypothetical protein
MGQPINVVFTRSYKPGIYRFEVNRCLTGMDHERFLVDDEITGNTPSDELARRLFSLEGVVGVHLNSNMITVKSDGSELSTDRLIETISDLHLFYSDGLEAASDDETVDSDT